MEKRSQKVIQKRQEKLWKNIVKMYKEKTLYRMMKLNLVLIGTMILDLIPCSYVLGLEYLFEKNKNINTIVSITLVVWTFTASLIVFYLGKINESRHGISLIDRILARYSFIELGQLLAIFLGELLILIIAEIVNFPITIVASTLAVFFTMIYIFLMVCIELSDNIQELIMVDWRKQGNKYRESLLEKMICNINYENSREVEVLSVVLKESEFTVLDGYEGRAIGRRLTEQILESGKNVENLFHVIQNWYTDKNSSLEIKKGILTALVSNVTAKNLFFCEELLAIDLVHENELFVWYVTLNTYLIKFKGEGWRKNYVEILKEKRGNKWRKEEKKDMLIYWEQLREEMEEKYNDYNELLKLALYNEQEEIL